MIDRPDDLRDALAAAPLPGAADKARRDAREAALRHFDADADAPNIATDRQGTADAARRRIGKAALVAALRRRLTMVLDRMSTRTAALGGASLAVLTLAVVATQEIWREPASRAPELAATKPLAPETPIQGYAPGIVEPQDDLATAASPALQMPAAAEEQFRSPRNGSERLKVRIRRAGSLNDYTLDSQNEAAPASPVRTAEPAVRAYRDQGRDNFEEIEPNRIKLAAEDPVSTFSIDVDTASYAVVRAALMNGVLPQKDAVRVEEMVNYFPYDYPAPESRETPFRGDVEIMPTPWNPGTRLMRIGIQGYELPPAEKPRSNLVFLIDTSGSMNAPDKLPLLINSFRLLVEALDPDDTVSIVSYAGSAGTVLAPTPVSETEKVLASLERLHAGGSTAGGEGIRQAYRLAGESFARGGVNRVILATDGDFNVGITDISELKGFVERKRETGIFLSVLGFGRGNYNDALMQALAQNGNGSAAYIDTLSEARKTLVEEASSMLFPIAKDVKIQVEFNPATVAEYRLIGYETRLLNREDFRNDRVDAGEIGSGHAVTALYEITPVGSAARRVDDLRYQPARSAVPDGATDEYAFLKIRYKAPDGAESRLVTRAITTGDETADPGTETRFAASVAAFGQLLRGGRHMGNFGYDDVISLANGAKGADPFGYRAEFVNLVRLAKSAAELEPLRR